MRIYTMFYGQAQQDKFIVNMLNSKMRGFFLEIGSNDPVKINNTYVLETFFKWKGIMVEYTESFLPSYQKIRKNSIHVINDATQIDYVTLFEKNNVPLSIDYLQIDLEAHNLSSLNALIKLDNTILDKYKFATVTFEHDIWTTDVGNTRAKSREILEKRGYVRVFSDIHNIEPQYVYEDWYVHPDLVDMNYVNEVIELNSASYVNNNITGKSINWQDIQYPERT